MIISTEKPPSNERFSDYLEESKKDFPIQMTNADRTFAMYHLGEELPEYINDMVKGVLEHGAV